MDVIAHAIGNISAVGSSPIIFIIAGAVCLYFLINRNWLKVTFTILSLGSGLCSAFLKSVFKLARPENYVPNEFIPLEKVLTSEVYSFPSTHTVVYTAFFGYLIYLSYTQRGFDRLVRHLVRLFSAFMVLCVGGSRVFLGAHYVRDVVAGYIFGLIYLGLLIAGEKLLAQKLSGRRLKSKRP